jgi:hypothetical protein
MRRMSATRTSIIAVMLAVAVAGCADPYAHPSRPDPAARPAVPPAPRPDAVDRAAEAFAAR